MRGTDMIVALAGIAMAAVVVRSVFALIAKRLDARGRPGLSGETEQRIARIEQAVDAIALEVERISEGQRFTTRLLSERAAPATGMPAPPPPARQ